jgi:hypothetical protein
MKIHLQGVLKVKKKILIVSILAVFMLMAISFATAVGQNSSSDVEEKESPLYGIRTKQAVGEKISNIIENIKTKFLGERVFFVPYRWFGQEPRAPLGKWGKGFTGLPLCTVVFTLCNPFICNFMAGC